MALKLWTSGNPVTSENVTNVMMNDKNRSIRRMQIPSFHLKYSENKIQRSLKSPEKKSSHFYGSYPSILYTFCKCISLSSNYCTLVHSTDFGDNINMTYSKCKAII